MDQKEEKSTSVKKQLQLKPVDKKDLLASGVQFGHQIQRWNPKMREVILGKKKGIHIIDVEKTLSSLIDAMKFLAENEFTTNVIIVGTKKQARDIIRDEAVRSGAFFVDRRWAGGTFTNFSVVRKSLDKLIELEKVFIDGVAGRTKYEVGLMKKEWERLNDLYGGIKTMRAKPYAVIVLDVNYEKSAVREAKKMGIPVVGVVDTNTDPTGIDYPIYANDDAISSIKIIISNLAEALLQNQNNEKVAHEFKDFSQVEVKLTKDEFTTHKLPDENEDIVIIKSDEIDDKTNKRSDSKIKKKDTKGILGKYQAKKESK